MTGIKDLDELIKTMEPKAQIGDYVFVTFKNQPQIGAEPLMSFKEKEGITWILEKNEAESLNLDFDQTWSWISLSVHSDLEAVGFLAAITEVLAKAGISVNTVSAYFHDHLFVQKNDLGKALEVLNEISG